MPALARFAQDALAVVLPPRCAGCRAIVGTPESFCAACFAALVFITPPVCPRCGDPASTDMAGEACHRCRRELPVFTAARAPFAYADPAKAVVLDLKHGDATHQARIMARQMARVGRDWLDDAAVLVPVPLHPRRLWRRGFNQAALLARALNRLSNTPIAVDALVRTRATSASGGMSRVERFRNVEGAFALARPEAVAGRAVILVDDVLTSGATAGACATTLFAGGARAVNVLTFARVVLADTRIHK